LAWNSGRSGLKRTSVVAMDVLLRLNGSAPEISARGG